MFREPVLNKIKLPVMAVILAFLLGLTAYAEVSAENGKGSIEVILRSEETNEAVSGGKMTLYKVGEVINESIITSGFILTEEFSKSGFSLDEPDAELALKLAEYAEKQEIKGTCGTIGEDGRVIFYELEEGLYLLVQTEAANGYYAVNPFLVSLPFYDEKTQTYQHTVKAEPKTETEPGPEETEPSGGAPHHGPGGSSGGSSFGGNSSGGPGVVEDNPEGGDEIWNLLPLPQTGQDRAMLIGTAALVLSVVVLMILLRFKHKGKQAR